MITPRRFRLDWWFLQNDQIVTAAPRPVAHTEVLVIPSNEIDALQDIGEAQMMPLHQSERILPKHEITARHQYADSFTTTGVDVVAAHGWQLAAFTLPDALIAVFQPVQIFAVLRIEEYQPRAAIRPRL